MDHPSHDDAVPAACEQYCVNDLPIPAKVKLFEHQPGDQVFLLAPSAGAPIVTGATLVTPLFDRLHPPPGIALYARFGRLAL